MRDCNSNETKLSSLVASNIAASSATRGWKSCDLLFNVDGKGVGSGNTGNTENKNFICSIINSDSHHFWVK